MEVKLFTLVAVNKIDGSEQFLASRYCVDLCEWCCFLDSNPELIPNEFLDSVWKLKLEVENDWVVSDKEPL